MKDHDFYSVLFVIFVVVALVSIAFGIGATRRDLVRLTDTIQQAERGR